MSTLLPWPRAKFFTNNTNTPLAGGKVYTYAAGTSTPLATYSDEALTTPNTNPVILDANGEASIHLIAPTKIDVFNASDEQVPGYPVDYLSTPELLIASVYAYFAGNSVSNNGASRVGYYDPIAPTYLKTVSDIINGDRVSFFRFVLPTKHTGILAGSNTDDLSDNWDAAAAAGNYHLNVPRGIYNITRAINFSGAMTVEGEGKSLSRIKQKTADKDTFIFTGGDPVQVRHLQFYTDVVKTNGSAIVLDASVGNSNVHSRIIDNSFYDMFRGVYAQRAYGWEVASNYFARSISSSIRCENATSADQGDCNISNNFLEGSGSTIDGVIILAGGIKLTQNKILGGQYGIRMLWPASATSADLNIIGGSIEAQTVRGIQLSCQNSTGFFGTANITGVQIAGQPVCIEVAGITPWLTDLIISGGCLLTLGNGASAIGILLNQMQFGLIEDYHIRGGGGATPVGIQLGATATDVTINPGRFSNLTNPIQDGGTRTIINAINKQGTAGTVTTNGAYGSMYTGTVAVVFPTPFIVAPTSVQCNVAGAGGGVSAWASAITTSGFTLNAVGLTNGGSVTGCTYITSGGVT